MQEQETGLINLRVQPNQQSCRTVLVGILAVVLVDPAFNQSSRFLTADQLQAAGVLSVYWAESVYQCA